VLEQATLAVRQARLQAQVSGQGAFTVPDLPQQPPEAAIAQIVAAEKDALASQLRIVKTKVDLLRAQKSRLFGEIEATQSEMASAAKRLELVQAELKRSSALVQQGVGTHSAAVQLELAVSTEETTIWRLKAEIFRLGRDLDDLNLKIEGETLSMQKEAADELSKVRNRIGELELLVPTARADRDWRRQIAGGPIDPEGGYRITITRVRAGVPKVSAADSTTLLEPGDVVTVMPANRPSGQQLY
jgi:exopolysaccharide production protein ExoF